MSSGAVVAGGTLADGIGLPMAGQSTQRQLRVLTGRAIRGITTPAWIAQHGIPNKQPIAGLVKHRW